MSNDIALRKPPRVQALPQDVVDRIAAGEVIHRPASIVKELVENSLDSGSYNIDIQCTSGGLTLLTVSDDGSGIHPVDLRLAATRFTTSKLVAFEDLKSIKTLGFRGEALASVSMISRLTITSRISNPIQKKNLISPYSTSCAYRQTYHDAQPSTSKPSPTAGKEGTSVKIQDIFYNIPARRRAFIGKRKEKEEYNRILTVVQRYAIHRASDGVGFVCRTRSHRSDSETCSSHDLNTSSLPCVKFIQSWRKEKNQHLPLTEEMRNNATKEVIGHIFGSSLVRELLTLSCGKGEIEEFNMPSIGERNIDVQYPFSYQASGFLSNEYYVAPRSSSAFILFINGRLVESTSLRNAVEKTFSDTLQKGALPFIFLDVKLPGSHVDVNVHPTKREVVFLHEENICKDLAQSVRELLQSVNSSKTFYTNPLFTSCEVEPTPTLEKDEKDNKNRNKAIVPLKNKVINNNKKISHSQRKSHLSTKKTYYNPKNLVRTNYASQQGSLEPFVVPNIHEMLIESNHKCREVDMSVPGAFASVCHCQILRGSQRLSSVPSPVIMMKKVIPTECSYASIQSLRTDITSRSHGELTTKIRESIFVGCISRERSLFQWGIELLMINHYDLSSELFYQLALTRFGGAPILKLGMNNLNVKELIEQSLQLEEHIHTVTMEKREQDLYIDTGKLTTSKINNDLGRQAAICLLENSDMLREYFSIDFIVKDDRVFLTGLPILLDGHIPAPHALPLFLLRLATEVNWEEERSCFEGICTELGSYYAEIPYDFEVQRGMTKIDGKSLLNDDVHTIDLIDENSKKIIQHTLFPALRSLLVPPKEFSTNGSVVKLATLSKLYNVFERC